jgi:soluble lytic murein transglycosylase-like protein
MGAVIHQESGGRGSAVGPQTQYGRALGSTQMLPDTAREMAAKTGLPWRPDLLQSDDPVALDYQRRLGAAYLQEGLQRTGNVRDALRYYHGGPDRSMWGPKTDAYANSILSSLGGQ